MDNIIKENKFRIKVITELNAIRTNPKAYAEKLKEYMKCFKGKVLRLPGTSVMTNEGVSAFKEACEFLEKVAPLQELHLNSGLTNVASDYLKAIERYEDLEEARDIDIQAIIDKYGYFSGEFRQSTDFGSSTPEMVAINIIVDDGDINREMRKVLFTERIKEIGISMGDHPTYNYCTVMLFTSKFNCNTEEEDKEEPEEVKSNEDNGKEHKEHQSPNKDKQELNAKDKENDDEDLDLPEDVVKMERSEKIVVEKGIKKKVIKIIYYKEDGTKNVEVMKEAL